MTVLIRYEFTGKRDGVVDCEESGIDTILAGDDIEDGRELLHLRADHWSRRYSWAIKQRGKNWWRVSDPDEGSIDLRVSVVNDDEEET